MKLRLILQVLFKFGGGVADCSRYYKGGDVHYLTTESGLLKRNFRVISALLTTADVTLSRISSGKPITEVGLKFEKKVTFREIVLFGSKAKMHIFLIFLTNQSVE